LAIGGFGAGGPRKGDAVVAWLLGGADEAENRADFESASRRAPLDHRYAYRAARGRLFPKGGVLTGADYVEALTLLERAARLAPSDGVVRLLLFQTAAALGLDGTAEQQALAAAALAPLNHQLKRLVARYFEDRWARHGGREDLSRAIGTREGDREAVLDLLRDDASLTYEAVAAAFAAAKVDRDWAVASLTSAGRHDWAVRFGTDSGVSGPVAAQALVARGAARMSAGDAAGARADLEEARRLSGNDFRETGLLGEVRLAAGDPEGGFASLAEALASGEDARSIAARIERAGMSVASVPFWEGEARNGRPAVVLELAEALLLVRRGAEASERLRDILDIPGVSGRANHLMARILLDAGHPAMARRYAKAAVAAEPRSTEFAEFLRRIGD
jgi:tetratricopeptide (TPR) repeat protein